MLHNNTQLYLIKLPISLLILMMSGCASSKNNTENTTEIAPVLAIAISLPEAKSESKTEFIEDDGLFDDAQFNDEQLEDDGLFDDAQFSDEQLEDDGLFADDDDDLFSNDSVTETAPTTEISDPFYYFNKAMFHVNDKLYFWVLRPTAVGYKAITPQFFRVGVANFFHNITMPIRFTSSVLQGDIESSGTELGRFAVNTTVGLLGVMDPAEDYLDWHPNNQDMGLTLGKYGIGNGPYIVWPIFGPSTLRDSVGKGTDYFLSPLTYLQPDKLSITVQAVDKVNATYFSLGDYEAFKQAYIDPYERMKEFYIEYRAEQVAEN
ncbi:VacJ family lipoprotein [Moritella marina ATCC 15381]|uniref:VacJ family lipoprotein n=1 Tax=Moritella marina ATCC 15381 TaxID=1202962 RepID=A0A5J6WP43_MORMI|nr:VacJ family lipoprotein [Moritella marina]QFI38685.1 VacJ family lipoprotein [Moritella marina ATCC 15381]